MAIEDAAPHILIHEQQQETLVGKAEEIVRGTLVQSALAYAGLGASETFPGRHGAYADVVALGEPARTRASYAPTQRQDSSRASSCGLVVRRIWANAGVRDNGLYPNYQTGSVMTTLDRVARVSGARIDGRVEQLLVKPGDMVFLGSGQHVFTIVRVNGDQIESVEGGREGGLSGGTEIEIVTRQLHRTRGRWYARELHQPVGRPIKWVADAFKLPFLGRLIVPKRPTPPT